MGRSLEHLGNSSNMDVPRDPEGINKDTNTAPSPKSFKEHMKELNELIDSLPTENEEEIDNAIENLAREQAIKDAREAVLQTFDRPKVNLKKPAIKVYGEDGSVVESYLKPSKTHTSWFNRYPKQTDEADKLIHESYGQGKPLKVLNIGVSQGQEALSYIQMASNLAGEDKINDALDLELVEYAVEIPITESELPENISESSRDYLKNLYQTDKAHFGTPFQEYVKELKDKGEKRDVVLFNNVIQHLDYENKSPEEMSKDMENLIDIVDENGMLCMTCEGNPASKPHIKALIDNTKEMLEKRGFYEETSGVFRKLPENLSEISATF